MLVHLTSITNKKLLDLLKTINVYRSHDHALRCLKFIDIGICLNILRKKELLLKFFNKNCEVCGPLVFP